ncbi:hypothetical protein BCR44DRAFT_1439691 [Catenaria anguillulae PL171]|uniref:Uncharacterized protein n=1 Tax=Catenaria anguillulae PL171 TaxID=765915 RepID=A0A1Y2HDL3_9FUNG|nr:hypothetical protein BCR44DRAFT_1439691 [Catenaria anguillulae PL171]
MNRLQSKPSLEHLFRVQKLFDSNDFISRNKALGPEARYFSALTPQEQDRVNSILATSDDENDAGEVDSDVDTSEYSDAVSSHSDKVQKEANRRAGSAESKRQHTQESHGGKAAKGPRREGSGTKSTTSIASTAYSVEGDDSKRLEEIHRKLTEIIPPEEWQLKLSTWSVPVSGWASPAPSNAPSVACSLPSIAASGHMSIASAGTAKSSFGGAGGLEEELKKLKEVELELERLKQEEPRPVSKEELENLLLHCLRTEILKNQNQQGQQKVEAMRAESVASSTSDRL